MVTACSLRLIRDPSPPRFVCKGAQLAWLTQSVGLGSCLLRGRIVCDAIFTPLRQRVKLESPVHATAYNQSTESIYTQIEKAYYLAGVLRMR